MHRNAALASDGHSAASRPDEGHNFWRESRLRGAALVCSILLAAQSTGLLLSWYGVGAAPFNPTVSGVPFNAALCFVFLAISIAGLATGHRGLARIAAAMALALSVATLVERLTSWSPGFDEIAWQLGARREMMRDAIDGARIVPMRMAANASLAIAAVSIGLLAVAMGRMNRSRLVLGAFGSLVSTLAGFVGVSGALLGLPTQYVWGNTPPMSPWTAVALIIVGLGVLSVASLVARRDGVYTGRIVPGVAATTVIISALLLWGALVDHDRRNLATVVRHQASALAAGLERNVDNRARVVDRLVQHRSIAGAESPGSQSVQASQIIRDFPGITAITWLDSLGVVTWRMAETSTADESIGVAFSRTPIREALLRTAREAGRAVISAPILHHGRSATVYMVAPTSRSSGVLSGYLVVDLIPERVALETLPEHFGDVYGYTLRDAGLTLAAQVGGEALTNAASAATVGLDARGRQWKLAVFPTDRTVAEYSSPLPTTFLIAALICAALAARIVWAAQIAAEQSRTLASTVKSLDAENEARRQAESLRDDNAELLQVQAAELAIQYRELQVTTDVLAAQRDELRLAQEFSAALVRSTVDAVAAFDNEGTVNTWNPAMAALTGWEHDDLADAHIGELLPFLGQGDETRLVQDALAGRATTKNAMRAAHQLWGGTVYLDLTVTPMRTPDGTVVGGLLVARDVTQQHHAAEVVLASKEAAEAASRAKSDFLARMSHELRTPLNAVIGFTNVILRNADNSLGKVQLTYLDRIRANGKHLLALINTVLDLTKIESGTETVDMAPTSVSILVRQTVADLEVNATSAGLHLEVFSPPTAYATTDPAKLKQVLINLIGNAVKFTARHGSIVVRVDADERTGQARRIDVEDTGIGVPADRLEAIFEAFEQADAQTAHVYGGTGLGLAISRKLCILMGHDLSAVSTPGKGSCFSIVFRPPADG
ncbi:MAG: PAS domain-containing sensor histidine kinase [Gemmatimonadota bacterium]|nr:PAS domain-containing sensor histidine kinase [Gemmatimonadota bacterium]